MKKKTTEPSDPHIRESHLAETFEKHSEPTIAPLSPTGIPMQLIAPLRVPTPTPLLEPTSPPEKEQAETKEKVKKAKLS